MSTDGESESGEEIESESDDSEGADSGDEDGGGSAATNSGAQGSGDRKTDSYVPEPEAVSSPVITGASDDARDGGESDGGREMADLEMTVRSIL